MRRFLKFTALFAVLLSLLTFNIIAAVANPLYRFGGSGTQADPFIIDSLADLEQLAANVSSGMHYSGASFRLTEDITIDSGIWTPIGTSSMPFSGKFDGNGHKISGISIVGNYSGLFGSLKNATVSNLYVSAGSISAVYQNETYSGVIAGIAENSTITGCAVSGSSATTISGTTYIGGMVGKMNGGQIKNCISYSSLNISFRTTNNIKLYAGNIVGMMTGSAVISSCGTSGNVSVTAIRNEAATGYGLYVGGIAGSAGEGTKIKETFTSGNVTFAGQELKGSTGAMVGELLGSVSGSYSTALPSVTVQPVYGTLGATASVSNVYYRRLFASSGITGTNCGSFTSASGSVTPDSGANFTSAPMLTLLNNNTSVKWVTSSNTNSGYPIQKDNTVTVSGSCGKNGSVTPNGSATYLKGDTGIVRFTPKDNYSVSSVTADGVSVEASETVTFTAMMANHKAHAEFSPNDIIITANAGMYGSISPSGEVTVKADGSVTFTIKPDKGCKIKELVVDGQVIPAATSYTFSNVNDNHYITAYFEENYPGSSLGGGSGSNNNNNNNNNNTGNGNNNSGTGNLPGNTGNSGGNANAGNNGNAGALTPPSADTENAPLLPPMTDSSDQSGSTQTPSDGTGADTSADTGADTNDKGNVTDKKDEVTKAPQSDDEQGSSGNVAAFVIGGAVIVLAAAAIVVAIIKIKKN